MDATGLPTAAGWSGITASVRGASHERSGKPNQDAVRLQKVEGPIPGLVAAISDGHGGDKYVRSDRGSMLGVEAACEVGQMALAEIGEDAEEETIRDRLGRVFAPAIVDDWNDRVRAHLRSNPLNSSETDRLGAALETHPTIAYGATLLTAIFAPTWVGLLQIGDGDIVTVTSGEVASPVPGDARLVANETTSLCLPTAQHDARTAAIVGHLPELVMLTSDGYANSFASPSWRSDTSLDMADQLMAKGLDGVRPLLPGWLSDSARAGGDDVSMALVIRSETPHEAGGSGVVELLDR